jgi:hypothetical protein
MSWAYWAPKSRIKIRSVAGSDGIVGYQLLLLERG